MRENQYYEIQELGITNIQKAVCRRQIVKNSMLRWRSEQILTSAYGKPRRKGDGLSVPLDL